MRQARALSQRGAENLRQYGIVVSEGTHVYIEKCDTFGDCWICHINGQQYHMDYACFRDIKLQPPMVAEPSTTDVIRELLFLREAKTNKLLPTAERQARYVRALTLAWATVRRNPNV